MASRNPWINLSMNAMRLGMEAQTVIGLRILRAAAGGPAAEAEAKLMISEKIASGIELQGQMMTAGLGLIGPGAPAKAVAHFRRKVRANRRRLLKGG